MDLKTIKTLKKLYELSCGILDGNSPLHIALVLTVVAEYEAREERLEVSDLMRETGLASSSVSRNLAALGDWRRQQRAGMKLVELHEDLADRRRKLVKLTKKGRTFMGQLGEVVEK